jgi:hypothetical protein
MVDLNDERIKNGNILKVVFIHPEYPCLWKVWEHIDGIDIDEDGTKYYRALLLYHSCDEGYCNNPHCNSETYRIKLDDYKNFIKSQFEYGYKLKNFNKCSCCEF